MPSVWKIATQQLVVTTNVLGSAKIMCIWSATQPCHTMIAAKSMVMMAVYIIMASNAMRKGKNYRLFLP